MKVEITETGQLTDIKAGWLVVGVQEDSAETAGLAEPLAAIHSRLRESGDLKGKLAELTVLLDVPEIAAERLIFLGLGKSDSLCSAKLNKALSTAFRHITGKQEASAAIDLGSIQAGSLSADECTQLITTAAEIAGAGQGLYQQEAGRFPITSLNILAEATSPLLETAAQTGQILGSAVNLTREMVDRTAADIYPESFAAKASEVAKEAGLYCEILDQAQLEAEKMGSLLGVAQGSDRPPRVAVLKHLKGGDKPTLALVGKGVTFDSGGLSLKTSEGMKTMKCDMAGAATVLGAMSAIGRLNLPVNVIGYMGLVENMVSGNSYKLGDVLTARNGVTIEVLNTDAEGRLVLADVLSYAADNGADRIIDLATLTGACVVALGEEVTGIFSNNDDWSSQVQAAAKTTGEDAWPMPMFAAFSEQLKSNVADVKNIGTRWGGAITAAKFLEKFVDETPWIHLDIAGPAFASSNSAHREGGGTGCMVRTLVRVAENLA